MKKIKKNIIALLMIIVLLITGINLPVFGEEVASDESQKLIENADANSVENIVETQNEEGLIGEASVNQSGAIDTPLNSGETEYEKTGKEENVYVNLNNDGSIKDIYVVNEFLLNENTEITDYGNYSEVRNLSSSDTVTNVEGKISLTGQKGKNFYQGKLNAENIPWNISVKYLLDGAETTLENMLGKSGKAEIKISITKNPNINETFFENFLLQTTLSLNTDICKNIVTEGATVANNGNDKQLTYMVLAGEEKEISIKFDCTNFELENGISFNGVLMSLVIDSLDTTEITSKVNELTNAVSKLNDGANTLKTGSTNFKSAINTLATNIQGVPAGSLQIKNGINSALTGVRTIRANLNTATNSDNNSSEAVKAQVMEQVSSILTTEPYASMIASNPAVLPALQSLLEQTITGTTTAVSSAYETQISSTITNLSTALSNLEGGLATLSNSYQGFDTGINTIVSGINSLNSSYEGIDTGINQISNGTSEMNSETQNLDSNVETTINEMLEKFKNSDYQVVSFVSDQNKDVRSVQFVIKTEGIKIKEEVKAEEEEEKEMSFGEKFINLFK